MEKTVSNKRIKFHLPPEGSLEITGEEDPLRYYYRPFVRLLYRARILQALSLVTPPYSSILELGYGSGVMMPTLASIGKTVSGIDIDANPEKVEKRLEQLGVKASLKRGDIRDMDYSAENFDLIVAISIFEHISDLETALNEVYRILKPDGELLVGIPRVDRLMTKFFEIIGYPAIEEHHVTGYRSFLNVAHKRFELMRLATIPPFVPSFGALYFNMLFRKSVS